MNYNIALERLYRLNRFHRFKYGLEASRALASLYGNPHHSLRFIHVTGTNGKGSVTFKTAKILEDNGLRTGLFTSPHLSTFRERIQIDGNFVEKEFITDFLIDLFRKMDRGEVQCSFFEALTIMALVYFKEKKTDVVCLEVGIGGKLDATNIIENNLIAMITSIGLDHCNLLGDSLEEITIQKCGIIKRNCPVLVGPTVSKIIVENYAKKLNSDFFALEQQKEKVSFWTLNELLVEKAIQILNQKHGLSLKVKREILSKNLPGRNESVCSELLKKVCRPDNLPKFVLMDVGHNEPAIKSLLESVSMQASDIPLIVVYGTSGLKDSFSSLRTIKGFAEVVYLIQGQNHRAKQIDILRKDAVTAGLQFRCISEGKISDTLKHVFDCEESRDKGIIICGSFFIMEEVRDSFGYNDEKDFLFLNEYASL